MAGQVQVFSRDGNLYSGMTIEAIKSDSKKSVQEKTKLIELFNKANTVQDNILDADEIKAYDKMFYANQADSCSFEIENEMKSKAYNESLAKVEDNSKTSLLAIGTGVAALGVTAFLAFKGIKSYKNIARELAETKSLLAQRTTELDAAKSALNDAKTVIAKVHELSQAQSRLPFMQIFKNIMNKGTEGLESTNKFAAEVSKLCKNISDIKNAI